MQNQQIFFQRCQTCGQDIPYLNLPIHKIRCNMKKQSSLLSNQSKLRSQKRKGYRKTEIFRQKQCQQEQQQQQRIRCSFCGYMQNYSELDTHPHQCPGLKSSCRYCEQHYPEELMPQHQSLCPNSPKIQQVQQINLQSPLNRLTQLLQLLNNISSIVVGMQEQPQGLSPKIISQLKKYDFKPKQTDQICTVCYCKFQKGQECFQLRCKHNYHTLCISKWFQKSSKCPVCKHDQNVQK